MAHYAEIDENNIVQQVIVINNNELLDETGQESEEKGAEFCKRIFGGNWIQTSYNNKIRGKFAGIGDFYDINEDIFIIPKPFDSWIREGSFWKAPKNMPQGEKKYIWNENIKDWVLNEFNDGELPK